MTYEYRYSIEDYHGEDYDDSDYIIVHYEQYLNSDSDREYLATQAAEDHRSNGGFEDRGWMEGEYPLKFWIWVDKETKFGYNVWCEFSPNFYVRG